MNRKKIKIDVHSFQFIQKNNVNCWNFINSLEIRPGDNIALLETISIRNKNGQIEKALSGRELLISITSKNNQNIEGVAPMYSAYKFKII